MIVVFVDINGDGDRQGIRIAKGGVDEIPRMARCGFE
jgi:hypothetical protein